MHLEVLTVPPAAGDHPAHDLPSAPQEDPARAPDPTDAARPGSAEHRPAPDDASAPAGERTPAESLPLTDREAQIVALVVDGLTNPEIGDALAISGRTAQSHVAAAMRKLDARTRTQLAVTALRTGLVPLRPGG